MISFSAPTIWSNDLLDYYASLPVHEVFGSLPFGPVGSGRAMFTLPKVDKRRAEEHIAYARTRGIAFNYILNAPCLGNMEFDAITHRKLIDYLSWIESTGAESVTVTIPYLIRIIKEQFPRLRVKISVIAGVNNVQALRAFERLGADEINIDYMSNRDFGSLAVLRDTASVDLTLLANDLCLYHCPYRQYHYNLVGHSTQENHFLDGAYFDFCMISCTIDKYSRPEEIIRARWIRPEDLSRYGALGFTRFKLSGRNMSSEWLRRMVGAYATRSYNGNLADLLSGTSFDARGTVHYYIDNKALDGFLDHFSDLQSCSTSCVSCGYCKQVADRVITFTPGKSKLFLNSCRMLLEGLSNGTVFEQLRQIIPDPANKVLHRKIKS
ncbi:MAG: U32 family peptidase [Chitinispirillaceae bacterium]|nr:U32 family peptidase [Chitinispirillaceae bacterium]